MARPQVGDAASPGPHFPYLPSGSNANQPLIRCSKNLINFFNVDVVAQRVTNSW